MAARGGRPGPAAGIGTRAGFAVDLGCGDGADTAELLRRGWTVLAVDRQPAAIALAEHNVPDHHRPRLRTLAADFTALALPAADLIYCGWSLPHCPATRFPGTWHAIRAALRPRGRIAAHLLGHRDDWALTPPPQLSARTPWTPSWPGWTSNTSKKPRRTATPSTGPSTGTTTRSSPANPRKPGASQGLPHALPAPRTLSRARSTRRHQPPPHTSPAHRTDEKGSVSRAGTYASWNWSREIGSGAGTKRQLPSTRPA
jgi:SAM-dependent methyltransferase